MIAIDTRWMGLHGIGRYAAEVIARLTVGWEAIGTEGNPASPLGLLRRATTQSESPFTVLYSPGYNGFRGVSRQIVTIHDLIHLQTAWPKRAKYLAYYQGFLRPLIRRHGLVVTVSETSRKAISEWLETPNVDVVNAGNGCSAAFRPDGPASSFDGPYFLYVGNLKAHKNVNTVLRALALVDGFSMVLVCSDVQGVRDLAAANGVSDRVTRVSGIDDSALAELYRGAAATLVPSFIEGFGLPALESLCSGTQVVYWEGCRSVAEICGSHGIAVSNARNVYEWAEAMITAARLPAARYNSGAYSWPAVASRVNGILEAQSR